MRILLISSAHPLEENPLPPLSLAYLAAALQRDGFEVEILDFLVNRYHPRKVWDKLAEYRPQMVGVTCVTMSYPLARSVLHMVREADPTVFTVIGGPHASFALEDTLLKSPWIDAVAIGEGDDTVVELARAVDSGGGIAHVRGIAFAEDGVVVRTEPRPLIADIDGLALPARHLIPMARYHALLAPCTVITSRGCPYGCLFCSASRMFGRKVRFRDPGLVVDEIETIRCNLGFRAINIVDDTFTVSHPHVQAICEEMLRRNLDITWSAYARVDNMTEDLVALMKRAGCQMVLFGLESADEGILKTIGKGITPEDMRNGVRTAREAGLDVYCSFIIGLPGESLQTIRTSMAFASEINADHGAEYGYHMLSPLPGTDLYERAADYGIQILTDNWAQFDANRPIIETPTMSPQMASQAMSVYEDIVEKAWRDIEEGADAGDARFIARLDARESRELIWSLIQREVIETSEKYGGALPPDTSVAEERLTRHAALVLGEPQNLVQRQVRRLVDRGLLQLMPQGDFYRWAWSEGSGTVSG